MRLRYRDAPLMYGIVVAPAVIVAAVCAFYGVWGGVVLGLAIAAMLACVFPIACTITPDAMVVQYGVRRVRITAAAVRRIGFRRDGYGRKQLGVRTRASLDPLDVRPMQWSSPEVMAAAVRRLVAAVPPDRVANPAEIEDALTTKDWWWGMTSASPGRALSGHWAWLSVGSRIALPIGCALVLVAGLRLLRWEPWYVNIATWVSLLALGVLLTIASVLGGVATKRKAVRIRQGQ